MTLISMLLALIIERLAVRSHGWQLVTYVRPYVQASAKAPLLGLSRHPYGVFAWLLLPAVLLQLVMWGVNFWLFDLIFSTVVLLICIGSWHYRKLYKQYLNAAGRHDDEAAFLTMQQLASDQGINNHELSHGQQLAWVNFKYYAAVLFWYAILGAFGAVVYACLRQLAEQQTYFPEEQAEIDREVTDGPVSTAANSHATAAADYASAGAVAADSIQTDSIQTDSIANDDEGALAPDASAKTTPQQHSRAEAIVGSDLVHYWQGVASDLCHWVEWLPVRFFGLGLALVGHFSRGSSVLMSYLGDTHTPGHQVFCDIARAAEPLPDETVNCSEESSIMVQLVKRNILFFLAVVAVLTLGGWLN